jgi:hypothetical protein
MFSLFWKKTLGKLTTEGAKGTQTKPNFPTDKQIKMTAPFGAAISVKVWLF